MAAVSQVAPTDATSTMPEVTATTTADLGAALNAYMSGRETTTVGTPQSEALVKEIQASKASSLDDLESQTPQATPAAEAKPAEAAPSEYLEFKVKGYDKPVQLPKNWDAPEVQEAINKGLRFDKVMATTAQQRKDLQAKLEKYKDHEENSAVASKVKAAQELMAAGHPDAALSQILGESSKEYVDRLVNEEIEYRSSSPEERLKIDIARKDRTASLAKKQDEDRIKQLENQISSRSEQVREAEFSGYVSDAKSRYDLGQWIDDAGVSKSLNDMVHTSAMSDIIALQRQREASGLENVSQKDIRRAYATRAKQILSHQERQATVKADQKISAQAAVAKETAQVASTKDYAGADPVAAWKKAGGSMSSLLDMMSGRGGSI